LGIPIRSVARKKGKEDVCKRRQKTTLNVQEYSMKCILVVYNRDKNKRARNTTACCVNNRNIDPIDNPEEGEEILPRLIDI
jgi:hypothetical protein